MVVASETRAYCCVKQQLYQFIFCTQCLLDLHLRQWLPSNTLVLLRFLLEHVYALYQLCDAETSTASTAALQLALG